MYIERRNGYTMSQRVQGMAAFVEDEIEELQLKNHAEE
jgi:hypothetical protein